MTWGLKHWRRRRILRREALADTLWQEACAPIGALRFLSSEAQARLRPLTLLFLHEKDITPAAGAALTELLRVQIAVQACLPILNLGLDYYDPWSSLIVYPHEFVPHHEYEDEAGVVHRTRYPILGEAWLQGPVVLSAADAVPVDDNDEVNIVIHECAHKLDMLNGDANGFPPLHRDMNVRRWSETFSRAYDELCTAVDAGADTVLDPYAAEAPGEFFAVASEAFFQIPQVLRGAHPDVYAQLAQFYRQDPAGAKAGGS